MSEETPAEQPAPAASEAPPRPEGRPEERSASMRPGRPGGGGRGGGGGRFGRRKVCAFCVDKVDHIDYKDPGKLRRYISERGKIEPRRKTGTCARHQRTLTVAIKRARHIALLPFTAGHARPTGGPPIRREQRAETPPPAEQPAETPVAPASGDVDGVGAPAETAATADAAAPDAEPSPTEVPEQELTEA